MTAKHRRIGGQNMTEGPVTDALRSCDVVIGQEIARWRIRLGLRGYKHFFPARDRHQSISAKRGVFTITATGYDRFHGSGTAEHLDFRTPARGMVWVVGYFNDAPTKEWFIGGVWLVNSWSKTGAKADQTTEGRKRLVLQRSLPVIEHRVGWALERGCRVYVEGDWNTVHTMPLVDGLTPVAGEHELDRGFVGDNDLTRLIGRPEHGPKTGVGPDLEHRALIVTLA